MMIPVPARRVFRLGLTMALSLAVAYGLGKPLPYLAPIFALFLTMAPKPPMGAKSLIGLSVVVGILTGSGLLVIPLLEHYPFTALLVVLVGLFVANLMSVAKGKGAVGSLLTVGLAMISAAGTLSFFAGVLVIQSLILGIVIAIVCQWLIYPFFPEEALPPKAKKTQASSEDSVWLAWRATLIVFPAYALTLTNPTAYLPIIMKSVSLGQQGSVLDAGKAARELLGSTFLGGCLAVVFWFALSFHPNLWMFFCGCSLSAYSWRSKFTD